MIHVSIFGGYQGWLHADKRLFLTLFGATSVQRQTLAKQIIARREHERHGDPLPQRPLFITLFGAASIRAPTLAEEYIDLRDMLDSGALTMQEWDRSLATLARWEPTPASLSLFGGFSEHELPSETAEVDAIAIQRHLGSLSEPAARVLQLGIGQATTDRRAVVRQAVLADRDVAAA
ncbi:MAG: hypothetical protein ACE5E6_01195 [Phycisphaerae bacterium]